MYIVSSKDVFKENNIAKKQKNPVSEDV